MHSFLARITEKAGVFFRTDLKYTIRNGGWLTLSQAFSFVLSLVSAYVFANYIDPTEYGTYKYILSTVGLLSLSTLPSMGTAILQATAVGALNVYREGIRVSIRYGTLGMAAALLVGLYYLWQGNQALGYSLLGISIGIPFLESFSLWSSYLAGKQDFKKASIFNSLTQTIILASTTGVLFFSQNIYLTLATFCLSTVVTHATMHYYVQRRFKEEMDAAAHESAPHLTFGKKLSVIGILGSAISKIDTIVVWHLTGPIAVAHYSFALATTTPIKTLFKTLFNLAHPKFAGASTDSIHASVTRKVLLLLLVFVPIGLAYIVLTPLLFKLFFPLYIDSIAYAQVLGITLMLYPTKLYSIAVLTRKDKRPIYLINTFGPIAHICTLIPLVYFFGIWGVVYTTLLDFASSTAITFYYFKKMGPAATVESTVS